MPENESNDHNTLGYSKNCRYSGTQQEMKPQQSFAVVFLLESGSLHAAFSMMHHQLGMLDTLVLVKHLAQLSRGEAYLGQAV